MGRGRSGRPRRVGALDDPFDPTDAPPALRVICARHGRLGIVDTRPAADSVQVFACESCGAAHAVAWPGLAAWAGERSGRILVG